MSDPALKRYWLGVSASVITAVSLVAFGTVTSISGGLPKSVAYSPSLLSAIYSVSPVISSVSGVVAVVMAVIALRHTPQALELALVGVAIGILLFFSATIMVANVITPVAPAPLEGKGAAPASFPLIALTPPAVGMAAVVIGVVAVLSLFRGPAGARPAVAAFITGGVVVAYWLLSLVVLNIGGE